MAYNYVLTRLFMDSCLNGWESCSPPRWEQDSWLGRFAHIYTMMLAKIVAAFSLRAWWWSVLWLQARRDAGMWNTGWNEVIWPDARFHLGPKETVRPALPFPTPLHLSHFVLWLSSSHTRPYHFSEVKRIWRLNCCRKRLMTLTQVFFFFLPYFR